MAKTYAVGPNLDDRALAEAVTDFLKGRGMAVQNISMAENRWLIQAVGKEAGKPEPGVDKAVSIRISLDGRVLEAEIGQGEWLDKVAGPAMSWQDFWPAMAAADPGAEWPAHLLEDIDQFIEAFVRHPAEGEPWAGALADAADASEAAGEPEAVSALEEPVQDLPPEALSAAEASAAAGQILPDGSAMRAGEKAQDSSL